MNIHTLQISEDSYKCLQNWELRKLPTMRRFNGVIIICYNCYSLVYESRSDRFKENPNTAHHIFILECEIAAV